MAVQELGREMMERANDGIVVRILWNAESDELFLEVSDFKQDKWWFCKIEAHEIGHSFDHPMLYEDRGLRQEQAVTEQIVEDTCDAHGVFCCSECFDVN